MSEKVHRIKEVEEITGVKRSAIMKGVVDGTFPAPIRILGQRAMGWLNSELMDLLNQRKKERDDGLSLPNADLGKE